MISFRDMAFCESSSECANNECLRHWNDDLQKQAVKWWGKEGAPVAFGQFKDVCGKFLERNN